MAGEEKTEKATPKKRKDSRKKGEVLQSKEVATAVFIVGIFAALSLLGQYIFKNLMEFMVTSLTNLSNTGSSAEFVIEISKQVVVTCIIILGPLLLIGMALSILPVIAQTRGLFTMQSVKFKFSKLNPFTGIKRMFSMQSVVGIVKGLIEISIIGVVVWLEISGRIADFANLMDTEPMAGVAYIGGAAMSIITTIIVMLVFVAAGDYIFQWWSFEKKLKMSKQEVKEEYKQMEGDPQIKSKIKRKQQEMAQQRMMSEVPTSDVVIRNPTHLAIALKYNQSFGLKAPVVVAKGSDALALKIVSVAEEHNVYVTQDIPLAHALYDNVEIGQEIPPDLYTAVAEVLAIVYRERNIKLDTRSRKDGMEQELS